MQIQQRQVVRTHEAQCRDCYRCLRHCPVKSIRMTGRQASVVSEYCLACGGCLDECPQKAKAYRKDVHLIRDWLAAGSKVAVSLAPAFAGCFEPWEWFRLVAALRKQGISYVAETAVGVEILSKKHAELLSLSNKSPVITSACPAVVTFIELYYPDLCKYLSPVLSPMLAHGAYLKQKLGSEWKCVFIGPCLAKKAEVDSNRNLGFVDAALGFEEVKQWFSDSELSLVNCEESSFDDEAKSLAKHYPLKGGHLHSLGLHVEAVVPSQWTACGFQEIKETLESIRQNPRPCHVELLFCPEGCVGGPLTGSKTSIFERRFRAASFAAQKVDSTNESDRQVNFDLSTQFEDKSSVLGGELNETDILEVLKGTGKLDPKDQLNCGSCGFPSCREKAIAVVKGMAVPDLCLPYMRRLAEKRTDRIIETSPNGIVILNEDLTIIGINNAFQKLFSCTNAFVGRKLSALMDTCLFEQLMTGKSERVEATVHHSRFGTICHEIAYALRDDNQYVGIFVNLTDAIGSQERLQSLQAQAALQASELLENQVRMAQQIARMLGEHTAQSEKIMNELIRIATDKVVSHDDWKTAFRLGKDSQ